MAVRLVSVVCLLGLYCLTAAAYPAQTDAGSKEEVVTTDSKPASKISSGTGLAEKANVKKKGKKAVKKTVKKEGSTAEAQAQGEIKESESNTTGSLKKQNETKPEEWNSKQNEKEETQLVTKPLLEMPGNLTTEKPDETSTESFETDQPRQTNATSKRTEEPKATTYTPEALQKEVGEQSNASVSDKSSGKSVVAMVSGVVNETIVTNEEKQKSTERASMEAYIKWSNELGTPEKKEKTKVKSNKKVIKAATGSARDRERLRLVWLLVFPFTLQLL